MPTDAEEATASDWKAYTIGKRLFVETQDGADYEVFSANGSLVYAGNEAQTDLPQAGVYIVRKGNDAKKVIVK